MKVTLNWLNDYVYLKDIPVQDIVHKLTMAGLEVEEVVDENEIYKGFIVASVKERIKHPNADKLSLCKVFTGSEELEVVCGAPNVQAGQKIVFAPIGTLIPKGNFKISKAKIRGVESNGMICSESELELSDDHSGIMVLPDSFKEGTPVTEALGLNDVIMEVAITPNRPDALSHFGIARDLSALYNREFKIPEIKLKESSEDIHQLASVEIQDQVNCPRYSAVILKDVEIKESPEWLKNRLTKVGLRPINNIVDVTNFVMYETGQPLHAFDLDKIGGSKIIVKSTSSEDIFTTLDSKERKLQPGTLMICDAERYVAIAGVMGGENSEVTNATKKILIESAYFNPSSVRRTSKYLGLSTEASYRLERGTNYDGTVYSAKRAAQLISELDGNASVKGVIDEYPREIAKKEITLRYDRVKKVLGYEIEKENINKILKSLQFGIIGTSEIGITVIVPGFRPDIEREIDVIEEIARIDGYDNIPAVSKISISLGHRYDETAFTDNIKTTANALGFYEMINNPLIAEDKASLIGKKIPLLNPQSLDMAFLRPSLIPGALETVSRNINYGEKNLALFEVGNVFNKISDDEIKSFDDFTEHTDLLLVLTGKVSEKEWHSDESYHNFFVLKGLVNSFLEKISLDNALNDSYYFDSDTIYDYYLVKLYGEKPAARGGKIRKSVLKKFDIQQDVYCFEVNVNLVKDIIQPEKQYKEPVKYPKIYRDFAFIFDKAVTYEQVKDYISRNGSRLLKSIKLFDLFESDSIGQDKKSMAFALEYFSDERTLTDEEVEKEFLSLINSVSKKFNATLRGN